MHLHNYLVDYCNSISTASEEDEIDRSIFVDDMYDNGIFNLVIHNDSIERDQGCPTNRERESRLNGLKLRNKIRDILHHHDMVRPSRSEWHYDSVDHIQRSSNIN